MATGDWSDRTVLSSGKQITAVCAGLTAAGITAFASGKAATYSCTSEINGTTSTGSRTDVPLLFNSAADYGNTTYVSDDFDDTNGTSLASHTPDTDAEAGGWSLLGTAAMEIQGNVVDATTGGAAVIETADANAIVEADIRVGSSFNSNGIVIRAVDADNYLFVVIQAGGNTAYLFERVSGSSTQLASAAVGTLNTSTYYNIRVVPDGNDISVYFEDALAFSHTTSRFNTATKHGLYLNAGFANDFSAVSAPTGALVTFDCTDPIHDDDTSVSIDFDAGLVSDGTNSSNADSSAVDNQNSALDYAQPACMIASEVLRKITGEFYVRVWAKAGVYKGYESERGIYRVGVTVTDSIIAGGGSAVTKYATAHSRLSKAFDNGPSDYNICFNVGPFDPTPGGDWGGGGAAQDLASIVATAEPKIGDADAKGSSFTEFVFLDGDDDWEVRHVVVDPTSGNDTTGRIAAGIGGYDPLAGGEDLLSETAVNNPMQTIAHAIYKLQAGDGTLGATSHGTASFSVVYLVEDDHTLGTHNAGRLINTSYGPVIITRVPGTTKASVKLTGSATSDGIRVGSFVLDDLTIELGAAGALNTGAVAAGSGALISVGEIMVRKNCDWVGPGSDSTSSATPVSGFDRVYDYGLSITGLRGAVYSGNVVIDSDMSDIANDTLAARSNSLFLNVDIDDIDPLDTGNHLDILQFTSSVANLCMSQVRIRNITHVQAPIFGNAGASSYTLSRIGLDLIICEDDGETEIAQLDDFALSGFYFTNCTLGDGLVYREDSGNFAQSNYWFVNNFIKAISTSGSPAVSATGHKTNHSIGESYLPGYDWTSGGTTGTLFANFATTYTPASGTDLLSRYADGTQIIPWDFWGVAGYGYIGAAAEAQDAADTAVGAAFFMQRVLPRWDRRKRGR